MPGGKPKKTECLLLSDKCNHAYLGGLRAESSTELKKINAGTVERALGDRRVPPGLEMLP